MTRWTSRLDAIIAGTVDRPPMADALDLPRLKGWAPGHVWLEWNVNPRMFTSAGTVFGGYLAALADQALGFAALSLLGDDEQITLAREDNGKLIARASATQVVVREPPVPAA